MIKRIVALLVKKRQKDKNVIPNAASVKIIPTEQEAYFMSLDGINEVNEF